MADEVALAAGFGPREADARVRFAVAEPERSAFLDACLGDGEVSWWRARRLVGDDMTGSVVEVSTHRYAPTERLREAVVLRDGVCRAPGCGVPASSCDLDHDVDHRSGGATDGANLSAKHRRHHQHKTRRLWSSHQDPFTGVITWTTLAGRTYVTRPWDYREHLQYHPSDSPSDLPF